MKCLEAIDMYGIPFTFTTFKREKFKTILGGLLTIVTIIILIVFFLLFGTDFFFRLNPKIISNTNIPDNYTKVYLANENYTFPWRLEDVNAQLLNFTGFLYKKISLKSYEFKNGSWSYKEHDFALTKCSEITIDETLKKQINPEEWFCLNFSASDKNEMMIGGFWDGDFINFINFDFFSCDEEGSRNKTCTSYEDLKKRMASYDRVYFTALCPSHYFSSEKKDDPFKKYYSLYSRTLDPNLIKSDRILLKEAKVYDDQGWIFSDIQQFKTLTFDRDFSNYDFKSVEDYNNIEISSRIYTFMLYLYKKEELYYRSYSKIQDLAAQTGGILKMVVFIFAFISSYHQLLLRNKHFISELFDSFEENKLNSEINSRIAHQSNWNESRVLNPIFPMKMNTEMHVLSTKIIRVNANPIIKENLETNKPSYEILSSVISDFNQYQKYKKKQNLLAKEGSFFVWKNLLCKKCIKEDKSTFVKGYNIALKYIEEKLDVKFYLRLVEDFIKIRTLNFSNEQNMCMNYLKKGNIMKDSDLNNELYFSDDTNNEFNGIIKEGNMWLYFMKNYQPTNLERPYENRTDLKLYEMMDDVNKEFIAENHRKYM